MRRSETLRTNKREVGEVVQNWENNKSFSQKLPRFQTAIDSTSLGAFKQCARYYYYSIICGYTKIGVQINLDFGSAAHHVSENYQRARSQGIEHEAALEATIVKALSGTWNYEANTPAFDDPQKNRLSLIRFAVEYLDHYEKQGSPLKTLQLDNGKPAVELTFLFDAGFRSMTDETILLCGHIDRLVEFNSDIYIADLKTTYEQIGSKYAERFTPDNQFTLYTIAGRLPEAFFWTPHRSASISSVSSAFPSTAPNQSWMSGSKPSHTGHLLWKAAP